MKIELPPSVWLGIIETFIRRIDPSNPDVLEIESGESWVSVHPMVLAMIAALGSEVDNKKIDLKNFKTLSRDEFTRMNFFKFLGSEAKSVEVDTEPAGKYIPITQIRDSDGLSNFIKDMVPLLHLDQDKSELISYVMSELGRNVLEHAKTPMGAFFAAEYSRDQNTIRIGIADCGIGLRASLQQSHHVKDDMEAIRLALTPGITGATSREGGTEQNAGAGLFFIKSISSANKNFMVIYSGDSLYKLLKRKDPILFLHPDPFDDNHTNESGFPYWQGTAVGIDITLNSSIEFTAVMELIRDAYANAIRERKRLRKYKQPKFI